MTLESVPEQGIPPAPKGTKKAGKRLWNAILVDFDLSEHELSLLRQAVATADLCDALQALVAADGPMLGGRSHPALVELRQQRILLARLVVALRVPLGDEVSAAGDRTQFRGVRGVYAIKGVAS